MELFHQKSISHFFLLFISHAFVYAQKPGARDIGIPFDGIPVKFNAITDVSGQFFTYEDLLNY